MQCGLCVYGLISRHDKYAERMINDGSSMNDNVNEVGDNKCANTNDDNDSSSYYYYLKVKLQRLKYIRDYVNTSK